MRIAGQGLGTILVYQGEGGAVRVETGVDITLERFTILARPLDDDAGNQLPVHGVAALNTAQLAMRRLTVLVASPDPEDRFDFGIALDGTQIGTKIEECVSVAPHALGSRSSYGLDEDGDLQFVAFAELRTLDCIFFGGREAVLFDEGALNIAAARLERNLVLSFGGGMRMNLAEIPAASLSIDTSTVVANRDGLVLSAGTLRVQDCEISGGDPGIDGIRLVPNLLQELLSDCQIIGNTVHAFNGAGIRIAGLHDALFIKRNIVRDCGQGGIITAPEASVRHIAIDNNAIEDIGRNNEGDRGTGIALTRVQSGQVIGNSIRNVGEPGSQGGQYAGIAVQAVVSVDISSNAVSEIGINQPGSIAVGILAQPPLLGLTIGANRIFGELTTSDEQVNWRAIQVGPPVDDEQLERGSPGVPANGYRTTIPVSDSNRLFFVNGGDSTWALTEDGLANAMPVSPIQLSCTDNQVQSAERLTDAMVTLSVAGGTGVTFNGNQCRLQGGGGLREVVLLSAPRVVASGNTIDHSTDALSIRILIGRGGATTPIGNITSAGIDVIPGGMPGPFEALNIQV